AFPQHTRNFPGLDAGRDQEDFTFYICAQRCGYIMRGFFDLALSPQIIIQRMTHVLIIETEKNMNPWGLNIRIHHAYSQPLQRAEICQVCTGVGFASSATERMNRNDL